MAFTPARALLRRPQMPLQGRDHRRDSRRTAAWAAAASREARQAALEESSLRASVPGREHQRAHESVSGAD